MSFAEGVLAAPIADDARVLADLLVAGLVQRTFRVGSAFHFHLGDCKIRFHF